MGLDASGVALWEFKFRIEYVCPRVFGVIDYREFGLVAWVYSCDRFMAAGWSRFCCSVSLNLNKPKP